MIENNKEKVIFPVLDNIQNKMQREVVQIFMQRYRDAPHDEDEIRMKHAIDKASNLVGYSTLYVTKILLDNGLEVASRCLPQEFIDYLRYVGGQKNKPMMYLKGFCPA